MPDTLYGQAEKAEGEAVIAITYGYSRDHRAESLWLADFILKVYLYAVGMVILVLPSGVWSALQGVLRLVLVSK